MYPAAGSHVPTTQCGSATLSLSCSWSICLIRCHSCLLTVLCVPGLSAKPSKADSCHQGPEVASHIDMSDRLMVSPSLPPLPLSSSSPRYATPRTGTQRTQARQGDFVCVECGKTFHQPSQLRAHLRAHTGITTTLGRVTGQCQVYACLYVGWGMGGRGICSSFIVVS